MKHGLHAVGKSPDTTWSLDREIVLSRVLDAPRALVYDVWTQPDHLTKWFCPKGTNPMNVPNGTICGDRGARARDLRVGDTPRAQGVTCSFIDRIKAAAP
jgi:uncharacterized protein YndB with AHSA1/START domain